MEKFIIIIRAKRSVVENNNLEKYIMRIENGEWRIMEKFINI